VDARCCISAVRVFVTVACLKHIHVVFVFILCLLAAAVCCKHKQHHIYKCGQPVWYRCEAGPRPLLQFSFTFGCLTAPFYGRPTEYCGKWDPLNLWGPDQRTSLKTSALQESQGSSDIEENKDQLSLTNPRDVRCITANLRKQMSGGSVWQTCDRTKLATLRVEIRRFAATAHAFNLSLLHLAPQLGVTPFEFCRVFLTSEN